MPKTSVQDTRRERLRYLIKEYGTGPLAKRLGYSSGSFLSQVAGPNPSRGVSEDVARSIEKLLALPDGWLDLPGDPAVPTPRAAPKARLEHDAAQAPLVSEVVRHVMTAAADTGTQPTPEKIAEVVTLAFERAAITGKVDADYVLRLLRLVG